MQAVDESEWLVDLNDRCIRLAASAGLDARSVSLIYSTSTTFRERAPYLFIGWNPAGDARNADAEQAIRERMWAGDQLLPCAFLDQSWGTNGSSPVGDDPRQRIVQELFMLLAGEPVAKVVDAMSRQGTDRLGARTIALLRETPATNILPFRSASPSDMDPLLARDGRVGIEIARRLRPRVLLANGNGQGESAWAVLTGDGRADLSLPVYGTFFYKERLLQSGPLAGTLVVGLPHLFRVRGAAQLFSVVSQRAAAIRRHAAA